MFTFSWIDYDEGNSSGGLKVRVFAPHAVIAELVAVVRPEGNEGVVRLTCFFKRLDQFSNE